jgi:hypothetical protein
MFRTTPRAWTTHAASGDEILIVASLIPAPVRARRCGNPVAAAAALRHHLPGSSLRLFLLFGSGARLAVARTSARTRLQAVSPPGSFIAMISSSARLVGKGGSRFRADARYAARASASERRFARCFLRSVSGGIIGMNVATPPLMRARISVPRRLSRPPCARGLSMPGGRPRFAMREILRASGNSANRHLPR